MKAESPLAVGIIGFGTSGSVFHAPLISSTPGFRLAAVATDLAEHQEKAKARYPSARVYRHADDLLADAQSFDLVVVSVTNDLHAEYGLRMVQAGVPVIVEKPLAPTADEAAALVEEADRRGSFLTVFQNRRWDGDFISVRQVIESGQIGRVHRFVSRFEWPQLDIAPGWREDPTPGLAGGVMFDLGSHLVDQALTLFGRVTEVYAETGVRRAGARIDDDSFISLLFANGVRAHLSMSKITAEPQARFHVVGSDGTYTKYALDPQEGQLATGVVPGDPGYGHEDPPARATLRFRSAAAQAPVAAGAYQDFYREVYDALRTGAGVPVDPADAVHALRVLEAARRSAAERCVIKFPTSRLGL